MLFRSTATVSVKVVEQTSTDPAPVTLDKLEVVFNQNGTVVYPSSGDDAAAILESLKHLVEVSATYSNGATKVLASEDYALTVENGELTPGECVLTVSYGGLTATATLEVTEISISGISAVFNQLGEIYTTGSLEDLKKWLTVNGINNDGSQVNGLTGYTLGGKLTAGKSVITVTYEGLSTTFTVNVSAVSFTLEATSNQGADDIIYLNTPIDSLKRFITVTANYSDGRAPETVTDYELSGTLVSGESTLTVSYNGVTTTVKIGRAHV